MVNLHCDQCEMLSINGLPCHETGCPNSGAKWDGDRWVKYHDCFYCGCSVESGEECYCQEVDEDDEEE